MFDDDNAYICLRCTMTNQRWFSICIIFIILLSIISIYSYKLFADKERSVEQQPMNTVTSTTWVDETPNQILVYDGKYENDFKEIDDSYSIEFILDMINNQSVDVDHLETSNQVAYLDVDGFIINIHLIGDIVYFQSEFGIKRLSSTSELLTILGIL